MLVPVYRVTLVLTVYIAAFQAIRGAKITQFFIKYVGVEEFVSWTCLIPSWFSDVLRFWLPFFFRNFRKGYFHHYWRMPGVVITKVDRTSINNHIKESLVDKEMIQN